MSEFTESVIGRLREFMHETNRSTGDPAGVLSLEEALAASFESLKQRHGSCRVHQNIDPGLRRLRCHENVGRAAAHLVENGLQASGPDGPVHIAARLAAPDCIELVVTDDGPGIPQKSLDAVFHPGFTTRHPQGGLGMGLSIARDMIEALGGTIELTPRPGRGTRALLRVPTVAVVPSPVEEHLDAEL